MPETKKENPPILRIFLFLIILLSLLAAASRLSIYLYYPRNQMNNYYSRSLFEEEKNSIDVLTIGTSNVYSSVSPLTMWNAHGFTGYTWGEPSQRIYETYHYLKKIYQHQSPKVVLIDVGYLFRDTSDCANLDSIIKANIADYLPIVTYHLALKRLSPQKLINMNNAVIKKTSITKGYYIRKETKPVKGKIKYMKADKQAQSLNFFAQAALKRCIALCEKNGSQVILLSVPSYTSWDIAKHNSLEKFSQRVNIPFLDLNLLLKKDIKWKTDSCDGGSHLNIKGALTVSSYLGDYLTSHYSLPDHRQDDAYKRWNEWNNQYQEFLTKPLSSVCGMP